MDFDVVRFGGNSRAEISAEKEILMEVSQIEARIARAENDIASKLIIRRKIVGLIHNRKFDKICEEFYSTNVWKNFAKIVKSWNDDFEIYDEIEINKMLLSGARDSTSSAEKIFKSATKNERRSAKFVAKFLRARGIFSDILFVGGGANPITPMILARSFKNISAMDFDENALRLGEKFAQKFGAKINFISADAIFFKNYKNFRVIVVAAMINDKNRLLEEIRWQTDAPVIMRSPINIRAEILYSRISQKPPLRRIGKSYETVDFLY